MNINLVVDGLPTRSCVAPVSRAAGKKITPIDRLGAPEKIDIVLINRPDILPSGGGEPPKRTVPAATAHADFDATGIRMRKAPLTAQKMQDALARV